MPGCPLRNACVRPSWLTGPSRSKAKSKKQKAKSKKQKAKSKKQKAKSKKQGGLAADRALWEWSDTLSDSGRFFRRVLAVAGWEGLSLSFFRR
ncbi:hypothetical protein [Pseudomonas brassicacearum]|uniref:hypothetical protein n=1 Tax=Pseudomonas brassicacearum TaxID=930166 RepID=UPI00161AABA4|nr:hypothetical protein [Pseudomonas brassicacearum]